MIVQIPPSDWPKLQAMFVRDFGTDELPDAETTEIYAEVDESGIVGLFLLERVVHMTLLVSPEHRGNGVARRLASEALKLTEGREGYISATRPEIEHLAEDLGLTRVEGALYCKEKTHVR